MNEGLNLFVRNLYYLSSLAKYNSERRVEIMRFCDAAIRNGSIFENSVSTQDVGRFHESRKRSRSGHDAIRKDIDEDTMLTLGGVVNPNLNRIYMARRYRQIESVFFEETGFYVNSLMAMENLLEARILARAKENRLLNEVYKFETGDEVIDPSFLAEPNELFRSRWSSCITFIEREILVNYALGFLRLDGLYEAFTSNVIERDANSLMQSKISEGRKILSELSLDFKPKGYKAFDILIRPLVRLRCKTDFRTYYLVVFPNILGSTTQIRVDNLIQNSLRLSKVDESGKGKVVEKISAEILNDFPNKNVIRNFKYKIGDEVFETDVLLMLENSIWAMEVKSHPIFRRIPLELDKLTPIYVEKVVEGINQGKRTLDWISKRSDLLFSLNCSKNPGNMTKGVIVLLDGFIPTLMTQNEAYDKDFLGTDIIYRDMHSPPRIYVLTVMDLLALSLEHDSDRFEDFLLWRTNYLGAMPVASYEEREYWALFNHLRKKQIMRHLQEIIKAKGVLYYVSSRYTKKDYLQKLVKQGKVSDWLLR